ncbi:MAG: hypothetical protein KDM64_03345, partial [Verrucomicrobiae bacterium]|nr:hypothetical protein [Verrucomicrobiae bacterium]
RNPIPTKNSSLQYPSKNQTNLTIDSLRPITGLNRNPFLVAKKTGNPQIIRFFGRISSVIAVK